jgi:Holliday junction resolvase RusA-like endonuclease
MSDEPLVKCIVTPTRIHIHSVRKRLTDADGVSAKAVIDGLVNAGLFVDDSHQYIKEVSYSQEQGKKEETTVEIWEVEDVC